MSGLPPTFAQRVIFNLVWDVLPWGLVLYVDALMLYGANQMWASHGG